MPLTPKLRTFISEYMTDGNASRAARSAGYGATEKSSATAGNRLLKKREVQKEIQARLSDRVKASEITVQGLLKDLVDIKNRCMEAEPVLDREGNQTGEWKFDSRGALKAVEMLGKHLGMFQDAAPQVHVHNEAIGPQPIDLSEASTLELMEALLSKGTVYGIRPQATEVSVLPASTAGDSSSHSEADDDE